MATEIGIFALQIFAAEAMFYFRLWVMQTFMTALICSKSSTELTKKRKIKMSDLCRVSIEERDHDRDAYGDVDWCAKSIVDHKALKVLLMAGLGGRLQQHLEDNYNDPDLYPQYAFLFPDKNSGRLNLMEMYLGAELSEEYCAFVEREAGTLASIILG
jgi:hypothetical protein